MTTSTSVVHPLPTPVKQSLLPLETISFTSDSSEVCSEIVEMTGNGSGNVDGSDDGEEIEVEETVDESEDSKDVNGQSSKVRRRRKRKLRRQDIEECAIVDINEEDEGPEEVTMMGSRKSVRSINERVVQQPPIMTATTTTTTTGHHHHHLQENEGHKRNNSRTSSKQFVTPTIGVSRQTSLGSKTSSLDIRGGTTRMEKIANKIRVRDKV